MMKNAPSYGLRRLCASFRDPGTEARYRAEELEADAPYLRRLLPFLGIVFGLFLIPDYAVLGWSPEFRITLTARSLFLLVSFFASFRMGPGVPLRTKERLLALGMFLAIAAFGAALYAYRKANFHLQAMSVAIMIIAIYMVPNRLCVSVLGSGLLGALGLFYIRASEPAQPLEVSERAAYAVDFLLVAFFSASAWRITHRARRREYARARELDRLSRTDLLTGIGNRRDFDERLEAALASRKRYGQTAALLLLDLDRFKNVNDECGHQVGDQVLREVARRLESSLRTEDVLSRWGGEEFAILLPRAAEDSAREFAARVKSVISSKPIGCSGVLTASIGIAMLGEVDTPDSVLARADRALYRAKERGRDRVEFEV